MAFVKCLNLLGNVGDFFGECSLGNCEMDDFLLLTITLIIGECSNSSLYKLIISLEDIFGNSANIATNIKPYSV